MVIGIQNPANLLQREFARLELFNQGHAAAIFFGVMPIPMARLIRMKQPLAGIKIDRPGTQPHLPGELPDGVPSVIHILSLYKILLLQKGFLRSLVFRTFIFCNIHHYCIFVKRT
jgi:hypothetical protein